MCLYLGKRNTNVCDSQNNNGNGLLQLGLEVCNLEKGSIYVPLFIKMLKVTPNENWVCHAGRIVTMLIIKRDMYVIKKSESGADPGFGVGSPGPWRRNGGGRLSPLPGRSFDLAILGFRNRACSCHFILPSR